MIKKFGRCLLFPRMLSEANLQNHKICNAYRHQYSVGVVFGRLNSDFPSSNL